MPPGGDGRQPGQRIRACRRSATDDAASTDSRARWLAAYEDMRRRHLAGETLLAISRSTGLARATMRKYAHADAYLAHAVDRLARGHLATSLSELLPWNCKYALAAKTA